MNKERCDIVRDLMPLAIDGVASDGSRKLVEEHVAACEPCSSVWSDMRSKTPKPAEAKPDDLTFRKALVQMLRAIRLRNLLIGAFVALALFIGGGFGYDALFNAYNALIPLSVIDYSLSLASDGAVLETRAFSIPLQKYAIAPRYSDDDPAILFIQIRKPVISFGAAREDSDTSWNGFRLVNNQLLYERWEPTEPTQNLSYYTGGWKRTASEVREIRLGTPENYRVLYKEGDQIPPCSPEQEADYQKNVQFYNRAP